MRKRLSAAIVAVIITLSMPLALLAAPAATPKATPVANATAKDAAPAKILPKVAILATGGTIAGAAASATDLTQYKAGTLSPEQLLSAVPSLKEYANITTDQVASISSNNMTFEVWLTLANKVNEYLAKADIDGVVITHGTDTIEETAYFLNLVVKSKKPVVLVGAMRPATAISADGPLNLLNAVAVAGSKDAQGQGVMVVMNGQINAARDVSKTSTLAVETFKSNELGFLGYVINYEPRFYRTVTRKHTADTEFDISKVTSLPRVDIIYNDVNTSLDMTKAAIDAGAKGIVNAGTGNGSLLNANRDLLAAAVKDKKIAVVRSSRVGSTPVTPNTNYMALGFVPADNLSPQKARILLMLALTKTSDQQELMRIFATY